MKKILTILLLIPLLIQAQTVKSYVTGEYWCGIIGSDSVLYAYDNASSTPIALTLPSSQKVASAAVGFNDFRVVSTAGNYYRSSYYNIQPFVYTQTRRLNAIANTGAAAMPTESLRSSAVRDASPVLV